MNYFETKIKIPFIVFTVLLLPLRSLAQAPDDNEEEKNHSLYAFSISDIEEQISVGSNVIFEKDKQPVSVTSITQNQILLSGARTVSEAIMFYVPGYFIVEDQDDLIAGFRGMATDNNSKVMLLINGQNINTEFFWGPPDAILNSTNFNYIERIEVIRGPGSVTLGQGALLGVINIITKKSINKDKKISAEINGFVGADGYYKTNASVSINKEDFNAYLYLSYDDFDGQKLKNEGWVQQQGNQGVNGGTVFDMDHHLRKSENTTFNGVINYKNLEFNILHSSQTRDLYNFYRDREILEENLSSFNVSYNLEFNDNTKLQLNASYAVDNFGLFSKTNNIQMGGTREDRSGLKGILNANNLFKNNKLAFGFEYRNYQMGKENNDNNNFIANVVGTIPTDANDQLTMAFRDDINVFSLFAEDFYSINEQLDLFVAFRYDNHPFWGSNISPRAGLLYTPKKDLILRLTYQTGFRGAVGLHYTGGYRRDGFLRAENHGKVSEANIPDEMNIEDVEPEKMNSFEFEIKYNITENFSIDFVGFYNTIQNVIDVGVIWKDPNDFTMVNVGSDIAGDWNGYWFFKNTPGSFNQIGTETSFQYNDVKWNVSLSHSLVKVANATDEQKNLARSGSSMYLANDNDNFHFKAYPENIFKLNANWITNEKLMFSLNTLYYSNWYSPIGSSADGGLLINLGTAFKFNDNVQLSLIGKNLLNEDNLYPMNSNAGGPDVSPGTPAIEETTFWAILNVRF